MVEASVVAIGKSHHELSGLLRRAAEGDAILPEHRGRDEGHLVPQEGLADLGAAREQLPGQALQALPVLGGHRVPGLGLPKVHIVDAVQVHVLRVPREGGLPHAKVQVRCVDPLDDDTTFLLQQVLNGPQVAKVPLSSAFIK
jgi:hypothetical protein